MKTNEGCCELCGHYVALRQKAHIVAERDRSTENILLLCPCCHVLFDHQLKPRLYLALTRAGVSGLPESWATSHYDQGGAAGWKALQSQRAGGTGGCVQQAEPEISVPEAKARGESDSAAMGTIYSLDQLEELLRTVAGHSAGEAHTALVPQVGSEYKPDRGLLVVGRAINGWGEPEEGANTQFSLAEIADPAVRRGYAERTLGFVDADPLAWVNEYGPRSAFWRVARRVAEGLGVDGEHWYRRIAWSNLYKVGPADAGNPSDALMDVQQAVCIQLLRHELVELKPLRVLFLVGCGVEANWFQWFEQPLGFVEDGHGEVAGHAIRWGHIGTSRVLVLPHPQGKQEGRLAEAALQHFRTGEQREVAPCS